MGSVTAKIANKETASKLRSDLFAIVGKKVNISVGTASCRCHYKIQVGNLLVTEFEKIVEYLSANSFVDIFAMPIASSPYLPIYKMDCGNGKARVSVMLLT